MPVEGVARRTCSHSSHVAIVRVILSSGCVTALGDAHLLRSGDQDSSVHDLRRTFATKLRDAGVPKWTVSACLGHKDGGVTELYALPTLRELRAAVETLEGTDSRRLLRSSSVIFPSVFDQAEAETYRMNPDLAGGYGWT